MVLYIEKFNIHPDKLEAFNKWSIDAIKRSLAIPGVVEFRSYRPVSGTSQVAVTYEFNDLAAWAEWQSHEEIQDLVTETHTYALNVEYELWGPSPVVPAPIRPGK